MRLHFSAAFGRKTPFWGGLQPKKYYFGATYAKKHYFGRPPAKKVLFWVTYARKTLIWGGLRLSQHFRDRISLNLLFFWPKFLDFWQFLMVICSFLAPIWRLHFPKFFLALHAEVIFFIETSNFGAPRLYFSENFSIVEIRGYSEGGLFLTVL